MASEDDGGVPARIRARRLVVVSLVMLIAATAWFGWTRIHPGGPEERMCTVTGAIGSPVAATPDAAFEAWWQAGGPEASMHWVSYPTPTEGVEPPTRQDFVKLSDTQWEWVYAKGRTVGVDVAHGPDVLIQGDGWAVAGVNGCAYGQLHDS